MELIEQLEKQSDNISDDEHRKYYKVEAGDYAMSVQGSVGHYSTPRETLPACEYTKMELALFGKTGWLHIEKSSVLRAFNRYDELIERKDGHVYPVFAYVPVDLLNELYLYLKNHQ